VAVARGLGELTDVAFAPGEPGRLYAVERHGRVVVVSGGRAATTPFLDLRGRVSHAGERGLLSLAFAPDYATSRALYVDFVDTQGRIHVARYTAAGTRVDPDGRTDLLVVPAVSPFHNGGDLAFGPDGAPYVSVGDGGVRASPGCRERPPRGCHQLVDPGMAQSLQTERGKILRLDAEDKPTVIAYGLRNPWRFSFDRRRGDIWIGDLGSTVSRRSTSCGAAPRRPSTSAGSVWEGRTRRPGAGSVNPVGKLTWPVASYGHARGNCSIIGGFVYRGTLVPRLAGRYVYGDYCSGRIWSFAGRTRVEAATVPSLTSFAEDGAGELYACRSAARSTRCAD
jgi:Glucose / Sorbosone dehydrogenase